MTDTPLDRTDWTRAPAAERVSRTNALLKDERLELLLLISTCLLLLFVALGDIPLYNNDEGLHAVTSRDMVLSGDWVTTTFNGETFYDKPALYNWFAAAAFLLFGFTEFAARLPAALFGLATVLVTYALGRRMAGPRLGFLGGMILATSPEFITLSRAVVHDISLVFFVTATLALFYFGYTATTKRGRFFLPFYAACGCAVLAKGPVGLVLPGAAIGLFLLLRGRLGFVKHMSLGWGIVIFTAVVAPWYVLISLANPDYAGYFFIQQNLMNFISPQAARHPEPFYYYLPVLLGGFMPWSVLLPLAVVNPLRQRLRDMEDGPLFLLLWAGVVLVFFSAAASKLGTYILPLFPAVALLVGAVCQRLITAPTTRLRRGFLISWTPLTVLFIAALPYAMLFPPTVLESTYGIDLTTGKVLLLLLAVVSCFALCALVKGWFATFFGGSVALVVSGILFFLLAITPSMNPYRTTIEIAREVDRRLAPGRKLVFFKGIRETALFYTGRQAIDVGAPKDLLDHILDPDSPYVIIEKKHYDRFPLIRRLSEVILREGNDLLIRGNSPAPVH